MEEKVRYILIGAAILILICSSFVLSVGLGMSNTRTNQNCKTKFDEYTTLGESTNKIEITPNISNVKIHIPNKICLEDSIDLNIINGNVEGDLENVKTTNITTKNILANI